MPIASSLIVTPKSISAVIPSDEVLKRIQAHYIESVAQAEDEYVHKDEESLTEALGAAYVSLDETIEAVDYAGHLVADYRKLHKRKKGAADGRHRGIFQIELMDDPRSVQYRFGLLFHAKVQWRGRDADLLAQSRRLNGNFRRGIVMDYSAEGYTAASATNPPRRNFRRAPASKLSWPRRRRARATGSIRPRDGVRGRNTWAPTAEPRAA